MAATKKKGKVVKDARGRDRNYRKEYDEYHGKAGPKKRRAKVNAARKKVGLKKGDPREVDHKKPLKKGGSNAKGNLRKVSRKANRTKATK